MLPVLQLPHHRQGREHGPHHGHDDRNQAGDNVVARLQVLVEPEPGLGVHRHLLAARAFGAEPLPQKFLVVRPGHPLDVTEHDVGGVGIGAVHQGLPLGGLPRLVLPGKIIGQHQARLGPALQDQALQFVVTLGVLHQPEVFGAPELVDKVLAQLAPLLVIDRQGNVLDVEGEGITIEQQEQDGQQDDLEEADGVPPDVDQLFAGNGPGAFEVHGLAVSR